MFVILAGITNINTVIMFMDFSIFAVDQAEEEQMREPIIIDHFLIGIGQEKAIGTFSPKLQSHKGL